MFSSVFLQLFLLHNKAFFFFLKEFLCGTSTAELTVFRGFSSLRLEAKGWRPNWIFGRLLDGTQCWKKNKLNFSGKKDLCPPAPLTLGEKRGRIAGGRRGGILTTVYSDNRNKKFLLHKMLKKDPKIFGTEGHAPPRHPYTLGRGVNLERFCGPVSWPTSTAHSFYAILFPLQSNLFGCRHSSKVHNCVLACRSMADRPSSQQPWSAKLLKFRKLERPRKFQEQKVLCCQNFIF